jgi:hypothetical protein
MLHCLEEQLFFHRLLLKSASQLLLVIVTRFEKKELNSEYNDKTTKTSPENEGTDNSLTFSQERLSNSQQSYHEMFVCTLVSIYLLISPGGGASE